MTKEELYAMAMEAGIPAHHITLKPNIMNRNQLILRKVSNDIAKIALARTSVFSERRFTTFRNECLNAYTLERNDLVMNAATDDVLQNFNSYEEIIRDVFNTNKNKK